MLLIWNYGKTLNQNFLFTIISSHFIKRDNKNLCLQKHKKDLRGKNKYTEPKSWSICQALMYVVTGDYDVFIYNGLLRWKLIFSLKAKCIRKSFQVKMQWTKYLSNAFHILLLLRIKNFIFAIHYIIYIIHITYIV